MSKETSVATADRRLSEALPCIVCGRRLDNVTNDGTNQPFNGLAFKSNGHYGSTVYDPSAALGRPRTHLVVSICDGCLVKATEGGMVREGVTAFARPITSYSPFQTQDSATAEASKEDPA